MSEIHQFKCDKCKTRVNSNYNGEHHLSPEGWVEFYDSNLAEMLDQHLCPQCQPKKPRKKENE